MGKGSTGLVILSRHRCSDLYYAIKVISKAKVRGVFSSKNENFSELRILSQLTSEKCPQMIKLIETFED